MKELKQPTELCLLCNKPLSDSQGFLADLFIDDPICSACREKIKQFNKAINLDGLKVHGLYVYDDAISSWIIQYKECLDEILAPYFLTPFVWQLKLKYSNCVFVPAPSSKEKLEERGFCHVGEVFSTINGQIENCFVKTEDVKQSSRNKKERNQISEQIELIALPTKKRVVLVDDICTTGNTLLAMHRLFKENGIESTALVLALHPLLIPKNDSIRQLEKFILTKK